TAFMAAPRSEDIGPEGSVGAASVRQARSLPTGERHLPPRSHFFVTYHLCAPSQTPDPPCARMTIGSEKSGVRLQRRPENPPPPVFGKSLAIFDNQQQNRR